MYIHPPKKPGYQNLVYYFWSRYLQASARFFENWNFGPDKFLDIREISIISSTWKYEYYTFKSAFFRMWLKLLKICKIQKEFKHFSLCVFLCRKLLYDHRATVHWWKEVSAILMVYFFNLVLDGLVVTHLPDGPTLHFKLSSVRLTTEIKVWNIEHFWSVTNVCT